MSKYASINASQSIASINACQSMQSRRRMCTSKKRQRPSKMQGRTAAEAARICATRMLVARSWWPCVLSSCGDGVVVLMCWCVASDVPGALSLLSCRLTCLLSCSLLFFQDVGGMHASEGILTQRGGMTSHAAVVARGWGKTCVVGCMEMQVCVCV